MRPIIKFLRYRIWTGLKQSIVLIALAAVTLQTAAAAAGPVCGEALFDGPYTLIQNNPGSAAIYTLDPGTDLGFGGPERDMIYLGFYYSGYGASGPIDLGSAPNDNYSTCEVCLSVLEDLDMGSQPAKFMFPSTGVINIIQLTLPGTAFELDVSFSELQVVEVTIDPETASSVPVPGGVCYVQKSGIFRDGFES